MATLDNCCVHMCMCMCVCDVYVNLCNQLILIVTRDLDSTLKDPLGPPSGTGWILPRTVVCTSSSKRTKRKGKERKGQPM